MVTIKWCCFSKWCFVSMCFQLSPLRNCCKQIYLPPSVTLHRCALEPLIGSIYGSLLRLCMSDVRTTIVSQHCDPVCTHSYFTHVACLPMQKRAEMCTCEGILVLLVLLCSILKFVCLAYSKQLFDNLLDQSGPLSFFISLTQMCLQKYILLHPNYDNLPIGCVFLFLCIAKQVYSFCSQLCLYPFKEDKNLVLLHRENYCFILYRYLPNKR